MIGLVRAELLRLRSRRMALVTVIALLVAVGLFQIVVNYALSPPSAAALAASQQSYNDAHTQWQQAITSCVSGGQSQQECVDNYPEPQLSDFSAQAASLAEIGMVAMQLAAYLSLLAAYLVGASFIGAEYSTGSLANWLTFVPERLKVYGSKLATVVLGSAALSAVVTFLTLGVAVILARVHGSATTAAGDLAAFGGRAVVVAVVAGIFGFVIALVTRHTVAAVGLVLGYLVVSFVFRALAFVVPFFGYLPPWLPDRNLQAFLEHGATYAVMPTGAPIGSDLVEKTISFTHGSVYLLVALVVVTVGAAYMFRRRDVT